MKTKHEILIILFFAVNCCFAQLYDPIDWKTSAKKISENEYELITTALIEKGWHLYSQSVPEGGPVPTHFNYGVSEGQVGLLGGTVEDEGHTSFDPIFEMEITYFKNKAVFRQKVKVEDGISTVAGSVEFMVCDNEKCLPPMEEELLFRLRPGSGNVKNRSIGNGVGMVPEDLEGNFPKEEGQLPSKDLLTLFLIAFLSGFAALLTPCVFPMVPLTVSYFTKQSKSRAMGVRNALLYGTSIIVIYVLLGSVVTALFGADSLNALATNVWFNVIFFLILVVFAISFLGAFEITLPSSWANKVDKQSTKGGVVGIFFMALALAIVSFSCTGPIVGTLLVEAASKGGIAPMVGMLGFSMAIAIPFALFAAFPTWLNSLPKSGEWLNTIKVVLGFLELALAFKFLSQADLVLQLNLLERELFLAIWIAIFIALVLYLLGKIRLPHDTPVTHISVGRLGLALLVFSFAIYLIPGLWGAPLKLISAFPPPLEYSESPYGVGYSKSGAGYGDGNREELPDGAHFLAPHDIMVFNDYDRGLAYAKKVGKPVMLDFTGWACVNCRKMEQTVWPEPEVLDVLKNELVLISLYVDDKRELSGFEVRESRLNPGKQLKYVGQKWSELQTLRYKANSQPFYVLMDHDGKNLIDPIAYTPSPDEYLSWLLGGIKNFKKGP